MKNKLFILFLTSILLVSCGTKVEKDESQNSTNTSQGSTDMNVGKSQTAKIDVNEVLKNDSDARISSLSEGSVVDPFGGIKKGKDIINEDARFRYYYQTTCPHCQTLNTVFETSKTYSQFAFERKEISSNYDNYKELIELANELKLDKEKLGVPFIYDTVSKKVLQGNEEIISFINEEMSKGDGNFSRKKSDGIKYEEMKIEQKEITHGENTKQTSTDTKGRTSEQ